MNYLSIPSDRLIGQWVMTKDGMRGDPTEDLINKLISTQLFYLCSANDDWDKLYINPPDATLLEATYPHGDMQGGGPRALCRISFKEADEKYKLSNLYALLKRVFDEHA
jgi:Immunity protein 27